MTTLSTEERLALLAAIVDSSDDAIISKSLDGIITSWNKSAERVFGYTADEAIGQPITIVIPADRLAEEPEILSRLRKGERVDHFETIRRRKDGTLFDISLTISPVRDSNGNIVGASKIAKDITATKKMVTELRRANTLLRQFADSAGHDLQEPLRTVKIYSEMLQYKLAGHLDSDGLTMLGLLQSGATRMEALLRDLLAYTRVTEFEKPPDRVDARLAYESALQSLSNSISETDAQVTANPLPSVRVHFVHLQQLFQNLVGNAIKYRNPDVAPILLISARRDATVWHFSVKDNGIGIEPEYREAVFGAFKRLHTAEEYAGTGLGLAICQRIVEQYDGRIWVESEPSRGSTFIFSIPD